MVLDRCAGDLGRVCRLVADRLTAAVRLSALERVHLAMSDWQDSRDRLAGVEARMAAVLDDLQLTGLITTIAGLPRPPRRRSWWLRDPPC